MKRTVTLFLVLTLLLNSRLAFCEITLSDQKELLEKEHDFNVIVIDPGHGGKDVGAHTKDGLYEKNVTLKVAKSLKSLIEKDLGLKVYLTRESDKFVSLAARARFANEKGADIFLSIHANASTYLNISGCETYFYDKDASDEQARLLAELENKGAISESDEPENPLEFILMDMAKSELIALSYNFAEIIQEEYVKSVKTRDRGVKQGPFNVLADVKMPAVLTEIGFLSSKKDGRRLKDKDYLKNISIALYNSVKEYKAIMDIKTRKKEAGK
jgi:N-acetylmuramoyl-L-alanine amidase